jgi:uncharacterized membrane protein
MATVQPKSKACVVPKRHTTGGDLVPAALVRPAIAELIKRRYPDWSADSFICRDDLDLFRAAYVQHAIEAEKGELSKLEEDVVRSLRENELLSRDLNKEFDSKMTFGERAADKVAEFGGSWRFIGIFAAVLFGWIVLNAVVLANRAFDPYPFILLNLAFSTQAAYAAPLILLAQTRQADRDKIAGMKAEQHREEETKMAETRVAAIKAETDKLTQLLEANTDLTRQDKELTEQVASLTREIHTLLSSADGSK